MSPAASIEMASWAAVGGRGTLVGPILGAFFVNGAKSWFTQAFPEFWLYFLGALFIAVTLFLPRGITGSRVRLRKKKGGEVREWRRNSRKPGRRCSNGIASRHRRRRPAV